MGDKISERERALGDAAAFLRSEADSIIVQFNRLSAEGLSFTAGGLQPMAHRIRQLADKIAALPDQRDAQ